MYICMYIKKKFIFLEEPKPSTIEEIEESTDAVHRRFLKDPSAKVKDGNIWKIIYIFENKIYISIFSKLFNL
jgi:uncharacterized protein Yka (UPF0111/DUF47 family)